MDIIVYDEQKRPRILIENKIGAQDQENQLLRYRNHAPAAALLYLTLAGDAPTAYSLGGDAWPEGRKPHQVVSYGKQILGWLEKCRKEAANLPVVRESLTQYIHLVNKLTNRNKSSKMTDEIVQYVLEDEKRLSAFFTLHHSADAVYKGILDKMKRDAEAIAFELHLDCMFGLTLEKESFLTFCDQKMKQMELQIEFGADHANLRSFYFGFSCSGELNRENVPTGLKAAFEERFGPAVESEWYPCYRYWDLWQSRDDALKEACFGAFPDNLRAHTKALLEIFTACQASVSPAGNAEI